MHFSHKLQFIYKVPEKYLISLQAKKALNTCVLVVLVPGSTRNIPEMRICWKNSRNPVPTFVFSNKLLHFLVLFRVDNHRWRTVQKVLFHDAPENCIGIRRFLAAVPFECRIWTFEQKFLLSLILNQTHSYPSERMFQTISLPQTTTRPQLQHL